MVRSLLLLAVVFAAGCRQPAPPPDPARQRAANREALFEAIQPVKLSNCEFERVGDKHDGGYLICGNLIARSEALYSYGISGSDAWGCQLSARTGLPVHQYDCFNTTRPVCGGATPVFHEECVGPKQETLEGRPFDSVESQIKKNGDAGKRVLMKMDVEGSEWQSFLAMPDAVLAQIDQLSVEFHEVEEAHYVEAMRKLTRHFYVVNVHYNNWACEPAVAPLMSKAFEVLFVNKSLGVVDPNGQALVPNPLDAPNNWMRPDCQVAQPTAAPPATESKSPR
jgi:hypothetical protein